MSRPKIIITILVALMVAIVVFLASQYRSATLGIQTRALEKGQKSILVEEINAGRTSRVNFVIGNDQGDFSMYAIELPAVRLKSVKIPPLATMGKFEIAGITLTNDDISYKWDEQLACTKQFLEQGVLRREACGSNAPVIATETDSSLVISSVPATGFDNSLPFRIAVAISALLGVLLAGWYVLRPTGESRFRDRLRHYVGRCLWLIVISLYLYQFYQLYRYAVDLPYYEEWEFFGPKALPNGISWQWLASPVSHQRMMLFTKLTAWLDFKLFNLDFVMLKVLNYLVFGGLLYLMVCFKNRVVGSDRFILFPAFMLFLLSPIAYEVHAASFQSGELFVLLFAAVMLNCTIGQEVSYKTTVVFTLCALLAMCSLSAGLVLAIIYLLCRTIHTTASIRKKQLAAAAGWRNLLLAWGMIAPSALVWLLGFKKPASTPPWLLPTEGKFWDTFLNLLSFCFGFEIEHPVPGIICLVLLLLPLLLLLKNRATRWEPATWQVLTAILGALATVALITVGRGNMPYSIRVSRYVIFGCLLIPYASLAWWLAVKTNIRRCVMLTFLWIFCAAAYLNDWDYGIYRDIRQQDVLNLECVERYNAGLGDGLCPGTHAYPIGNYFDNAQKLKAKFARQFGPSQRVN